MLLPFRLHASKWVSSIRNNLAGDCGVDLQGGGLRLQHLTIVFQQNIIQQSVYRLYSTSAVKPFSTLYDGIVLARSIGPGRTIRKGAWERCSGRGLAGRLPGEPRAFQSQSRTQIRAEKEETSPTQGATPHINSSRQFIDPLVHARDPSTHQRSLQRGRDNG